MELMQLEMFVAVVEERTVQKAAERVFRTQPAVSLALGKLEREIGLPLLQGSAAKGRTLTLAGEVLYEFASQAIGRRGAVLAELSGKLDACCGRLRLGVDGNAARWIPQLTGAFSYKFPRVRVEILQDHSLDLLEDLKHRKIDFVFLSTAPVNEAIDQNLLAMQFMEIAASNGLKAWFFRRHRGCSYVSKAFEEMITESSERPQPISASGVSHLDFISGPIVRRNL